MLMFVLCYRFQSPGIWTETTQLVQIDHQLQYVLKSKMKFISPLNMWKHLTFKSRTVLGPELLLLLLPGEGCVGLCSRGQCGRLHSGRGISLDLAPAPALALTIDN